MTQLLIDISKLGHVKREAALIGLSLMFGLALCFGINLIAQAKQAETVEKLSERVLRFHILANSDSPEDQRLKLSLRDAILFEYGALFSDTNDKQTAVDTVMSRLPEIESFAEAYLLSSGAAYEVTCKIVRESFPDREYGSMFFPAGVYDALRVNIGAAKGRNFWCVMFPPMCFVEASVAEEEGDTLVDGLSAQEYETVTGEIKMRSWIWEMFN